MPGCFFEKQWRFQWNIVEPLGVASGLEVTSPLNRSHPWFGRDMAQGEGMNWPGNHPSWDWYCATGWNETTSSRAARGK